MTNSAAYADVASVAAHLGVSPRTVRRMFKRGLPHVKLDDSQQGRVLVRWDDLDAWLADHTHR